MRVLELSESGYGCTIIHGSLAYTAAKSFIVIYFWIISSFSETNLRVICSSCYKNDHQLKQHDCKFTLTQSILHFHFPFESRNQIVILLLIQAVHFSNFIGPVAKGKGMTSSNPVMLLSISYLHCRCTFLESISPLLSLCHIQNVHKTKDCYHVLNRLVA